MAEIRWTAKELSGNRVRLTGKVRLTCSHSLSEGAQVRNTPRDIESGKTTVANLLTTLTTEHMKECKK